MCNLLLNEEQELVSSAGELVFMPAGTVYEGRYVEENTKVKIVQFDLSSGELPEYLSKPVKIDLPDAGELIDSFFLKESQSLFDPWGGLIRALCETGRLCHKVQEKKAYQICPAFRCE